MSKHKKQQTDSPRAAVTAPVEPGRRSFLRTVWIVLGGAALLEAGVIGASFLRPRKTISGSSRRQIVVAGPVERFEPGSVTAFPEGRFYLVRLDDGGFMALSRTCTHLGCTVPWDPALQRFTCPCHASAYDIRGDVFNAPAPRPLDLFTVRIENRVVKVETDQPIRRSAFAADQVTHV